MRRLLLSFGVVALVMGGGLLAGAGSASLAWARTSPYPGLDTQARAMTTIESHYVEEIDSTRLSRAAVRGMTLDLDPHSVYLDPDEYRALMDRTAGRWFGLGIEMRGHPHGVRIARVVPGSPAELGGLKEGDLIVAVDGVSVDGEPLDVISERLHGPRGEAVLLGIQRGEERLELSVVRDQVIALAVEGELVAPGKAYVHIESFRERAGVELERTLAGLAEQGGQPLTDIILDLRDNPGGLLEEAVAVADLFVGDDKLVETRGRDGRVQEAHKGSVQPGDLDARLVVLINGGSASASEIVAGALQDLERATIVGTPSFGKGSVQQVFEFEDGSALKLTVARYHLPTGRTFDRGAGVTPDIEVHLDGELSGAADRLRAALADARVSADTVPEPVWERVEADLALLQELSADLPEPEIHWTGGVTARIADDPQLKAAWELVQQGG